MLPYLKYKSEIDDNGFSIIYEIYSDQEIENILSIINQADHNKETFRKSSEIFAIRQVLKEIPDIKPLVFNEKLNSVINRILGVDYFVVKSIYFDKPGDSNWQVPYHQDLTISVDKKVNIDGFGPYTKKYNQFAVQAPIEILENIYTIRIHLDDTNENNGSLKVIPKSHLKKIYRPENINLNNEVEVNCELPKGAIMLMKPLILHSSNKTTNNKNRRVIHIEFSNSELPKELTWVERLDLNLSDK